MSHDYSKEDAALGLMIILIIFILMLLAGCGHTRGGRITYEGEGFIVTVEQPDDPSAPATLTVGADGAVGANVPPTHTPASYTEKATVNWLMVFGGLFAVAAVLLFVFKAKFPLMPSNAPMGFAIASAVCFMLPTAIDEYLPWILGGGALWAGWVYYSYRHNKRLKNEDPQI